MGPEEALADFVSRETPDRVEVLSRKLSAGVLSTDSTAARVGYHLPPGPKTVERALALLGSWPGDASSLDVALRAAAAVRAQTEARGPLIELAWTGPDPEPGIRTTAQIVDEMLRRASREVVIAQYAISPHEGTETVFDRLGELAATGVRITWIVDGGWRDGRSVKSIKALWPDRKPRPRILSYTVEDDAMAKLHAKVLVVDDRDVFVTSANLTGYGYGVNLEFGVRVQGAPAVAAGRQFDALAEGNALTEVDW